MRDSAVTARIMSAVRGKETVPERLLRSELWRRGLRFRKNVSCLPGKPDVLFPSARVVVFVDGDFWHGKGWRERGFTSFEAQFESHRDPEFWRAKIARNVARDRQVNRLLRAEGWTVVRVLESAIRRDVTAAADKVERALHRL